MKNPGRSFDGIESRAAAWLARRDGGLSAREAAEFARWCDSDPRHAAAVREIESTWAAFDRPSATGRTESLRGELRALEARDRRRWRARGAAGVCAVAACLAVYLSIQRPGPQEATALPPVVATARFSAPERQVLADGSVVEFKPGAEIAVAFSEEKRVVMLRKGEAHFSVMKNAQRPFFVEAGGVSVRAVGTAFAVQLGGKEVEVVVTEGKVSVAAAPPIEAAGSVSPRNDQALTAGPTGAPLVAAGQRTSVPLVPSAAVAAVVALSPTELAERLSWRVPRLEFTETTVAEAIALFNRHSATRLTTADGAVAAMRITGVFRADNIEGFVRALETSLRLRAEYGAGEIRLERRR